MLAAVPRIPGVSAYDPRVSTADLAVEAQELLRALIAFDTVNPPGNERPAQEYLRDVLADAGFQCELLGAEPGRPNLIARLRGEISDSTPPTLCYLGHVDTVLAEPSEWRHDPWSGELTDGCIWGRGALDMKSQVAAEVAAAVCLARSGWRPARGELLIVAVVDEETGGELGAHGPPSRFAGGPRRTRARRRPKTGVGCGRLAQVSCFLDARAVTVLWSGPMRETGEVAPVTLAAEVLAPGWLAQTLHRPSGAAAGCGTREDAALWLWWTCLLRDACGDDVLAMLGVTFTPTRIRAPEKINVIPSRAELKVDCRAPPWAAKRRSARHRQSPRDRPPGLASHDQGLTRHRMAVA